MGRFDAKTSLKGQTTIPVEVRRALGLQPGGRIQFIMDDNGVRLIAKTTTMRHLRGLFGPLSEPLDVDAAIEETVRRKTMPGQSD